MGSWAADRREVAHVFGHVFGPQCCGILLRGEAPKQSEGVGGAHWYLGGGEKVEGDVGGA